MNSSPRSGEAEANVEDGSSEHDGSSEDGVYADEESVNSDEESDDSDDDREPDENAAEDAQRRGPNLCFVVDDGAYSSDGSFDSRSRLPDHVP